MGVKDSPTLPTETPAAGTDPTHPAPLGIGSQAKLPTVEPAHYTRGGEIARGGMGRIVAARDRRLDRAVAIKELLRTDVESVTRFEREAVLSAQLEHPSIITVYGGSVERWRAVFAMKHLDARSLDRVVADAVTLDQRLALVPMVLAVYDALAYAHSRGVIHRDLKPSNVLVGEFGETVVIDWGSPRTCADRARRRHCRTHPPEGRRDGGWRGDGNSAYMPPEQASGDTVDQRADVYALGALLYHVLSGGPPYRGATSEVLIAAVLAGPPRPIREVVRVSHRNYQR
jgi:serine/threonine protein kinase